MDDGSGRDGRLPHAPGGGGDGRAPVRRTDARDGSARRGAGWIRPLASRDVGTYPHISFAFQGVPQAWDRGAPALGEDNDYVFRKLLGLDVDEYRRLVDAKVIVEDYLDPDMNPY